MKRIYLLLSLCIFTYISAQGQVRLNEDFSSGLLPTGWTMTSVSAGDSWEFGTTVDFGPSQVRPDASNNLGEYANIDFSDDPDTTSLITPKVSIGGLTTPRLTFYYITQTTSTSFSPFNRLILDYWNGTKWINITVIDSLTPAGWTFYDFPINSYAFNVDTVQFRFSAQEGGAAVGGTGTATFDQDLALDQVVIEETPTCFVTQNLAASNISSTTANLSWVDPNAAGSFEIEYDTAGFTLGTGTSTIVTTNPTTITGLTASTAYDFYVRAICAAADTSAWSSAASFVTACAPLTAPYNENFDGAGIGTGDFNNAGFTCWQAVGPGANDIDIVTSTDQAAPIPTGPNAVELNDGDWTGNDSAILVSPPFSDLSSGLNRIRFQAAFESVAAASVSMYVGVMTDPTNTGTFVILDTISAVDVGGTTNFGQVVINFNNTSLIGSAEYIAIAHGPGTFEAYVDSFTYEPIPANDLGIVSISGVSTKCGSNPDSVDVTITNFGSAAQSNFQLAYSVNGVAITPETFTGSIGAGNSATYRFSTTTTYPTGGSYIINAYTLLGTDVDNSNDTASTTAIILNNTSSFPYAESFETGNGGWLAEGNTTFELGVPAATIIDTASDGTQAWVTNLTGTYNSGENGWVNSPCFNFSNMVEPEIELDIWYDAENSFDGAVMQASIDGGATWFKIGADGDTVNWYNDNTISGLSGSGLEPSGEGWTGTGTGGSLAWITARHELDTLAGQSSVRLRIAFGSDGSVVDEGFGFDNVKIYDKYVVPYYPVGIINTVDANGVADSLNVRVRTSGTVVGIDLDGNNGLSFTIVDMSTSSQEGINIFNFNDVSNYVVNEGDSIMVIGDIDQFNGLQEVFVDSIMVISTNATIPSPILTNSLSESTESRWLELIDDFVLLDPSGTGGGSYNMDATNGTDTITIRVDSDTDVHDSLAITTNSLVAGDTVCMMRGVGGQFDNSNPFTSGYQIFPQRWSDVMFCRFVSGVAENQESNASLNIYPNPTNGLVTIQASKLSTNNARLIIRDLNGKIIFEDRLNSGSGHTQTLDFSDRANGVYFITIIDGDKLIHQKLIKN